MVKKTAPDIYKQNPKPVAKPTSAYLRSRGAAVALLRWIDIGDTPISVVLMHGLNFAREKSSDGTSIDMVRPGLKMEGSDGKRISEIMSLLKLPGVDRTQAVADWLLSVWVMKTGNSMSGNTMYGNTRAGNTRDGNTRTGDSRSEKSTKSKQASSSGGARRPVAKNVSNAEKATPSTSLPKKHPTVVIRKTRSIPKICL